MKIVTRPVSWWNGYDTLLIEDTPQVPTAEAMAKIREFIEERKPLFYVPLPFAEFTDIPPLRHYPDHRWKGCMYSLGADFVCGKRVIDLGSNLGYYAFLAAAAGAADAIALDNSPLAMELAHLVGNAYGIENFRVSGPMLIQQLDFEIEDIDIAFAFSSLPYIGQPSQGGPDALKAVLRDMARYVGVSFIEMGDGGSALDWCEGDDAFRALFEGCGFSAVEPITSVFSSHTNTQRTLWRCDGVGP